MAVSAFSIWSVTGFSGGVSVVCQDWGDGDVGEVSPEKPRWYLDEHVGGGFTVWEFGSELSCRRARFLFGVVF